MSDEKEPVVYSLEEAMRAVHWERLDELRDAHGNLADVQLEITEDGWWVFLNRDGKSKNEIKEFDEWEDAASFALDKKVISRERVMREAIREYLEAYIEDLEYHAETLITTDEEAEESNRKRERHMKALNALQAINNGEALK